MRKKATKNSELASPSLSEEDDALTGSTIVVPHRSFFSFPLAPSAFRRLSRLLLKHPPLSRSVTTFRVASTVMNDADCNPDIKKGGMDAKAEETPSSSGAHQNGTKSASEEEHSNAAVVHEENGDRDSKPAAVDSKPLIFFKPSVDVATLMAEEEKRVSMAVKDDNTDDDDGGQSVKSEGAEEEDALFETLEKEVEQEEAAHPMEQPSDTTAAPKLLQDALKQGQVKLDDSEHGDFAPNDEEKRGEAKVDGKGGDDHIHQRVSEAFCMHFASHSIFVFCRSSLHVFVQMPIPSIFFC